MSSFDAARALLPGALQALGLSLSAHAQERMLQHLALIAKWNRVHNLTAVRDPDEMFTHHLLDSLAAVGPLVRYWRRASGALDPVGPPGPLQLLDVGSGAGLPGLALGIALPEILGHGVDHEAPVRVTCVDAVAKKAGFIRQAAAELGLGHVQALHGRVEALSLSGMDVITCRAFARLADTVHLSRRHLADRGVWMALKGMVPHDEIAELPSDVEVFHVEPLRVPHLDAQRCLVWMRPRLLILSSSRPFVHS